MRISNNGRRLCALLCSALMCVGIMTGCGGEEEQAQITLRTMSIMGDDGQKQAYTALLEDYSAQYPYVYHLGTVAETANAYMLYANFEDTYTASKYPHAVYYYTDTGMDELSEHFVTVKEIRELYPDFASGISQAAFDSVRSRDGSVYCVPFAGRWKGLVLNDELMESASLSTPQSSTQLVSAVRTLAARGITPIADSPDNSAGLLELLCIGMEGERALDAMLGGQIPLAQLHADKWQEIFTTYQELCRMGAFGETAMTEELSEALMLKSTAPGTEASASDVPAEQIHEELKSDPIDLFNEGKAAMAVVDSSTYGSITIEDHSLMMFPTFSADSTERIMVGGFETGWYITRRAFQDKTVRDAVVAYVDAMTCADAAESFAALGFMPSADIEQTQPAEDGEEQIVPRYIESGLCDIADKASGFTPSRITSSNGAAFSRLELIAAALSMDIITPEQAVKLINDRSLELRDVIDRPEPAVSASDIVTSDSDAAVSGSDA